MKPSTCRVLSCFLFLLVLATSSARAEQVAGFKNEYLDDFAVTSRQVVQLAEAMPAEKYAWRPGEGVRSASEVYVHIAAGNFLLLALAGVKPPDEYFPRELASGKDSVQAIIEHNTKLEKSITEKDKVGRMLKASLDAVREQFSKLTPADLDKPADFFGDKTTVRRVYLRILAHVNEHMGQSIAYARVNGVVPPWSRAQSGAD